MDCIRVELNDLHVANDTSLIPTELNLLRKARPISFDQPTSVANASLNNRHEGAVLFAHGTPPPLPDPCPSVA